MIDERNDYLNQQDRQADTAEKRQFIKMCRCAVMQHDKYAREWLQRITRQSVLESLRNHPCYEELQRTGNEEQYISLTFEHFWRMADRQKLWLNSQYQVLRYLQATMNGIILEKLRADIRQKEEPPYPKTSPDGHILWSTIQGLLPDERERRVAYLLYHCGLKPVEIVRACPQEFGDVQEIHRMRSVVIEKIRPYL